MTITKSDYRLHVYFKFKGVQSVSTLNQYRCLLRPRRNLHLCLLPLSLVAHDLGKLNPTKQHHVTRKLAAYLVKDMRPFSTVENKYFREMIHACDESVVILNTDMFSQRIIPSWYNLDIAHLMEEMKTALHVALTSDCWTSRTTVSYMTITAHYFDTDFSIQAGVLQMRVLDEWHTRGNISVALNNDLECWQINDKVWVITTDNASNMGSAVQISDIELKNNCFGHILDLTWRISIEWLWQCALRALPLPSLFCLSVTKPWRCARSTRETRHLPKGWRVPLLETWKASIRMKTWGSSC